MIIMIDNYDSFTYNVYQAIGSICSDIQVFRNDEITIDEIEKMSPDALIISPGPSYPSEAGISEEAIKYFAGKLPILGICLGHQAIGEVFGGRIVRGEMPMHGKSSNIKINTDCRLFKGLDDHVEVARYHSLVIERATVPDCLEVVGETDDGVVMAVKHKEYEVYGVQFHPESVLTPTGMKMMENFVNGL